MQVRDEQSPTPGSLLSVLHYRFLDSQGKSTCWYNILDTVCADVWAGKTVHKGHMIDKNSKNKNVHYLSIIQG